MKRNYSKLISVAAALVIVLTFFAFPTPVYAGTQAGTAEQTAYAVFQNNGGNVGTQIGSDSSPVTVSTGQNVFVCLQISWTKVMKQCDMIGQWRTWGGTWQSMAVIGAGSSTAWEYWNSSYADHTANAITPAHFGDTTQGTYTFESDFVGYTGSYPATNVIGKNETWFIIQAPDNAARYEIRWYNSELLMAPTATVMVDITTPPSISNTPSSYDFGTLNEGGTYETTGGLTTAYFTVTNNSAYAVNITIGGTDMTGGTTWTLSNTATPGVDTYGLKAGLEGSSYSIIVKSSSPNFLVEGLASLGTQDWGLQILAPATFTGGGANSGTVTLTATQA